MASESIVRNGSCLCGKIRLVLQGEPAGNIMCHCMSCQKFSGSVYLPYSFFPADKVQIEDPEGVIHGFTDSSSDAGNVMTRSFCGSCGSAIKITHPLTVGSVAIPIGLMEGDKEPLKPSNEYFVKRKVGWGSQLEGTCQHQEMQ